MNLKWPAALILWTVAVPILGAADWIKISSANFDLYTNSREYEARQTLQTFELARDFFLRGESSLAGSSPPVTIVGFNSLREYRPYSAKETDLAYFLSRDEDDYIVISDLEIERMRVAIHEYVHLLVRHSGLSLPLWLNEGMAEVYSTLEARDGKLLLGAMYHDRADALGRNNWMRLPALLAAGAQSREYDDAAQETMFYAQSFLLAHLLMLGDGYAGRFPRFLERVSATGSSQAAFAEVYGKTVAEMERAMNTYFRQSAMGGAAYTAALPKFEIGQARPASEAEVGVTLANLSAHLGRREEARKRLEKLADAYPGNPRIEGSLANLEARNGERDAALGHYRAALAHGASGWRMYWDYARLLDAMGGEPEARLQALADALERKPDLTEARLLIGRNLDAAGRHSEALAELQQVKKVEPQHAVALYMEMAYVAFELKRETEARQYAEEAGKAARTPEESAAVDQLLRRLQQNAAEKRRTRPQPARLRTRRRIPSVPSCGACPRRRIGSSLDWARAHSKADIMPTLHIEQKCSIMAR